MGDTLQRWLADELLREGLNVHQQFLLKKKFPFFSSVHKKPIQQVGILIFFFFKVMVVQLKSH